MSNYIVALVGAAAFPIAFYVSTSHMAGLCWSDECVGGQLEAAFSQTLVLYYAFLAATASIAVAANVSKRVRNLLRFRPVQTSTLTAGELIWFAFALVFLLLVVPSMTWGHWWSVKRAKGQYWFRHFSRTILMVSGDVLAVLLGFLVLPMSKHSLIASLLKIPYSSMIRVHGWLGTLFGTLVASHLIGFILAKPTRAWVEIFKKLFIPSGSVYGHGKYQSFTGGLLLLVVAAVLTTSLVQVRRRKFNVFYFTHLILFPALVVGVYVHASNNLFFMLPGLIMYAVDGILRALSKRTPSVVVASTFEDCGYITVTIQTPLASNALPGQFMRVGFPLVSSKEMHPWTVAQCSDSTVTFLFRPSAGDWSTGVSKALEMFQSGEISELQAFVQGPFGQPMDIGTEEEDVVVFYVGGTGIATTVRGIERVLLANRSREKLCRTKVFLFWATPRKGGENLSLLRKWVFDVEEKLDETEEFVMEVFATKGDEVNNVTEQSQLLSGLNPVAYGAVSTSRRMWVDDFDEVEEGRSSCSIEINTPTENSKIRRGSEETLRDSVFLSFGRSHLESLFYKHVSPLIASRVSQDIMKIGLFVCGPEDFTKDAILAANGYARDLEGVRMNVEVESFDF